MNILTVPYIAGGLSHLIPLYVLQQKYLKPYLRVKNYFLVSNNLQNFLTMNGVHCVPVDYTFEENLIALNDLSKINECVVEMEKKAYDAVKPSLIIEDAACFTPLIAEKNHLPRISIQRTGTFRSIDKRKRNPKHVHSLRKGDDTEKVVSSLDSHKPHTPVNTDSDLHFLLKYKNPKVKIIPGIPTIECLTDSTENIESYFYSGPLLVMDKPSKSLSERLGRFVAINRQKPIVFITTGTIDRTNMEEIIEFFIRRNYAIITTCNFNINKIYTQEIFYNKFLPLNYVCGISSLVIHQCGSGMYHYPIMNRIPSLTIGTQCYDREDIAIRLQELGVSGHVPHPDDDPNYWNIFLEMVNRFERNTLINYDTIDKLKIEINETMLNFEIDKVIQYALG